MSAIEMAAQPPDVRLGGKADICLGSQDYYAHHPSLRWLNWIGAVLMASPCAGSQLLPNNPTPAVELQILIADLQLYFSV